MSATAPTAPEPRSRGLRVLLTLALVAFGFVAVWQGFGAAGYGTDAHAPRVGWLCFQLLGFALPLVWAKGWFSVRGLVALVFLGSACAAWWTVRASHLKGANSLREAVQARDWYKERLKVATPEEAQKSDGMRGVKSLCDEYPSLCSDLPVKYDRWTAAVADEIISRYRNLPLDDFKGAEALVAPAKSLSAAHPASADRLDAARRQWLSDALSAKTNELLNLPPGDWDAFNRTSFGRCQLAESLPDTRDLFLRTEADWVDSSVEHLVANKLGPKAAPPPRESWKQTHWELLTLKSLDTADGRFLKARSRLFYAAHAGAKAEALAHFEAGRYDRAFGLVRAHAVDWSATATALGEREQRALAELRSAYEFFDALAAKRPPELEVAPPPRPKP